MTDISGYLNQALLLFQALTASGIVKSSPTGAAIPQLVTDLEAVVTSAQTPSVDLAPKVQAVFADMKSAGIISGSVVDEIAAGFGQIAAFVKDVQSGQAAIIDSNAKLLGVAGDYVFIAKGGPAAQSLGLA